MRYSHSFLLVVGLACGCVGFAQTSASATSSPVNVSPTKATTTSKAPPAKLDNALRLRAKEFLLNQTEGNFRKAFELVADDSKDYYLSLSKQQLLEAEITAIAYSDRFKKAVVKASINGKANLGMAGTRNINSVRVDSWKLDKGKWYWFHDPDVDCLPSLIGALPCGSHTTGPAVDPKAVGSLPKDTKPESVAAAGKTALGTAKATLSRQDIVFTRDQEAAEEVIFHNGYPGFIKVVVMFDRKVEGLAVSEETKMIAANADFPVKVQYTPGSATPASLAIIFSVEPFGTSFTLPIKVLDKAASAGTQPKP